MSSRACGRPDARQTFLEAYFENGRVAMTVPIALAGGAPQLALTSSAPAVTLASAAVYRLKGIWTTPEAVRRAPRIYN